MADLFAEVVIMGSALNKGLHYSIPCRLAGKVQPGSRVSVELGKRKAAGIVLSVGNSLPELPETIKIRPIRDTIDELPAMPPDLLKLCIWVSKYYFYPLGQVFDLVIPFGGSEPIGSVLNGPVIKLVRLIDSQACESLKSEKSKEIVRLLRLAGGVACQRDLRKLCENPDYSLKKLIKDGIIAVEESQTGSGSDYPASCKAGTASDLLSKGGQGGFADIRALELTGDQSAALDQTAPFMDNPSFQPFVLYGVTGSGKTEIYLRLMEKAAQSGHGSLVLVPEIGISAQMESIFRERFGTSLAVWHSALPERERKRAWADIRSGRKKIVLGARSAVLTPVQDLKLIIVDEEHDTSYKQETHLRYNARDVALMRGKIVGAPVLMGSATPSIQTVHGCTEKRYRSILLPSRVMNRPRPEFEVVDMKREGGRHGIFSFKLSEAIGETIRSGRQALLFLNRRGYDKYYLCNACGQALQCASCSVTLTYHKKVNRLRCHYCESETLLPERCPVCAHAALFPHGFGTEKVEKEVRKLLPAARVVRMDRDTINSQDRLLSALDAVRSGKADVLLGTQMVAKGHDFPNITLVGIINADAGLQAPDFRAGEVLVQLLIQVAGRAGRGEEPGRVILQTYNPSHFTIESALNDDYDGFCREELKSREILQYPPFSRLLKMLVTSASEQSASDGARLLSVVCRQKADVFRNTGRSVAVLGPSPAAYVKLRNRFRWHLFVKTWTSSDMQSFTECVLESIKSDPAFRSVQITVDRDPATEM
jgi:primosomal protein N' (replication factor Y) (superfamily II helicase)